MKTTLDTRFSFLTTGPRFHVSLPADFKTPGHLTTPVSNGVGARSLIFMPADTMLAGGACSAHRHGGLEREIPSPLPFERYLAHPPLARVFPLRHLQEASGATRLEEVRVAHTIRLVDLPSFAHGSFIATRLSGGWDICLSTEEWSVSLYRPSFLREGQMVVMPEWEVANRSLVRAGATAGIEVLVGGPDLAGCRALAGEVAESLKEI
jgi:hypothetical protein